MSDALVEELLDAAMAAPSAGNQQPWHFIVMVGVWARNAGNTTDAPQASAGLAYELVPDIRGTYTGNGSATNTGCTFPDDNGTFSFRGSIAIATQTIKSFNGSGTFTDEEPVSIAFPGTVTGAGQVSGMLTVTGSMGVEGTLPYNGTVAGKTLSITFAGQTQEEGVVCNLTGTFTGTRP